VLICTGQPQCDLPQLSPTIDTIQIDQQKQTMLWTFTFTNNSTRECTNIGLDMNVFQDANGNNYEGDSRDINGGFDLAVDQSVHRHYQFPIAPQAGQSYTLFFNIQAQCPTFPSFNDYVVTFNF
jgi:hypothetical protein